jgi:hypothetical protein
MQPDPNAIERQHVELALSLGWKMFPYAAVGLPDSKQQWCPPGAEVHISTCRDLPTFDELLAHVRALEAERARLREENRSLLETGNVVALHARALTDIGAKAAMAQWSELIERLGAARAALDPNRSE